MKPKEIIQLPIVRAFAAVVAIVLLGCWFNADGAFFRWDTHRGMLRQISVYGVLACGMTIVILSGGIDLSVGSVAGLSAVFVSLMLVYWGWSPWAAVPLCLLAGAACGAISGTIIGWFGLQPFIATLAMMVFARGAAKLVSGGEKVSTYSDKAVLKADPGIFEFLNKELFGGNLVMVTLVFISCVAACWFILDRTVAGRYFYAIGGNEEAARFSGVPVRRMKIAAYALSGFLAALGGICQASQEYQGDPEAGQTYELTAIAMVVIGGTSLMGGRGGVLLTLIGTLTIGYLEKILSINAVSEAGRLMLTGAIIVAAALFQRQRQR